MDVGTTLVLSFLDTEGNEANLSIKNPKAALERANVVDVMEDVIDNEGIVSNQGNLLQSVNDCYYRTVTKTVLTDDGGGE